MNKDEGSSRLITENEVSAYIFDVNYNALAFDTTEIVFDMNSGGGLNDTNSILGYAVLGQMILG